MIRDGAQPSDLSRFKRSTRRWLGVVVMFVALLLLWEFAVKLLGIKEYLLPPPTKIWSDFLKRRVPVMNGAWITTVEIAAVGAFVPVYAVSDADARLNAGVRVPMIPSLFNDPSSVVVIVSVPTVGAVVSTVTSAGDASVAVAVIPAVSVTTARTE